MSNINIIQQTINFIYFHIHFQFEIALYRFRGYNVRIIVP